MPKATTLSLDGIIPFKPINVIILTERKINTKKPLNTINYFHLAQSLIKPQFIYQSNIFCTAALNEIASELKHYNLNRNTDKIVKDLKEGLANLKGKIRVLQASIDEINFSFKKANGVDLLKQQVKILQNTFNWIQALLFSLKQKTSNSMV